MIASFWFHWVSRQARLFAITQYPAFAWVSTWKRTLSLQFAGHFRTPQVWFALLLESRRISGRTKTRRWNWWSGQDYKIHKKRLSFWLRTLTRCRSDPMNHVNPVKSPFLFRTDPWIDPESKLFISRLTESSLCINQTSARNAASSCCAWDGISGPVAGSATNVQAGSERNVTFPGSGRRWHWLAQATSQVALGVLNPRPWRLSEELTRLSAVPKIPAS